MRVILTRCVAVDKYNLFYFLIFNCRKDIWGVIFNVSKSDTDWETCTPKYVIEAEHRSGAETALSIGTN